MNEDPTPKARTFRNVCLLRSKPTTDLELNRARACGNGCVRAMTFRNKIVILLLSKSTTTTTTIVQVNQTRAYVRVAMIVSTQ